MIDYHTHILPNMDDGSKDIETSLKMLTLLKEQGVDTCYLTSHFYRSENSVEDFLKRRNESYELLSKENLDGMPELKLGAEVYYFEGISMTDNVSELKKLVLEDTNYLMLEMPTTRWTKRMVEDILRLNDTGEFKVLLAHINRYSEFVSTDDMARLKLNGVHFQLNAECFSGFFSRRKNMWYLKKGYCNVFGSDCHNMEDRKPNMDILNVFN